MSSILEGVDENSPKPDLLRRLREAAKRLTEHEDKRVGALQEIHERVRRKYSAGQEPMIQIIATSTQKEWTVAVEFLEEWEDRLPVALLRIHDGAKMALDGGPTGPAGTQKEGS